jgi:CHAT domain-containing protein
MLRRFKKIPPSVFCLVFALFCLSKPLFCQTPAIEAADKALEIAKRDTTNALPYATSIRDIWQAYHNYLVAEKVGTPDTLSVLLINQDAAYRLSMDSLVKVSASVKGKAVRKLWRKIAEKETILYQDMVKSTERFVEYHYQEMGHIIKSVPYCEFLLALHAKLNNKNNYFRSVNDLAIIYGDAKKYESALFILDKAITELSPELERYGGLTQKEKEKPENQWLKKIRLPYTDLVTSVCLILHEKGDINAAIVAGKRAIVALKETLKDTSYKATDFISSNPYYQMARIYHNAYKPDSAILICNESLIYFPKEGANYFVPLIIAYQLKGDMVNFKKIAFESHELAQSLRDKTAAESLLFIFYLKTGQYTEARKWLDKYSEDILIQFNENSYLGGAITNFYKGKFYSAVGEFDKAELYINKAITIQKNLGYDSANLPDENRALAQIYDALGQYDKSLKIQQQAKLPLYENNRMSGLYWEILGYTYQKIGQLDSAQNCYERSYTIFKTGQKTIEFALNIYKLGYIAEFKHDFATAEKWYSEAQTCIDSIELTDPASKVTCLLSHSGLLRKRGQYPESLEKSQKSLAILRGLETTDIYRKAQLNRALLHEAQQQNAAAADSLNSLFQNIQTRIVKEFAYLPEADKVAFMTMLDNDFFGAMQAAYARLSLKGEAAKSGALFYNTVLMQKELSLVDTRSLKRKASILNDTLLFAQLFKLNAFEEQLKSDKPIPADVRQNRTTEIAQIRADLETKHPDLFTKDWLNINWQSVQKQLKPNEIAIEYADVLNNDDDTTKLRHYYALVITPTCAYPTVIPLFEEQELIQIFKATLVKNRDSETATNRYTGEYGKELSDLIWQPLENAGLLRGVKKVHFAPSGALNRVAFSALPILRSNIAKPLMELYELRQYNSTRDIFDATKERNTAKDLVLFGDMQYGTCDSGKIVEIEPLENKNDLVTRSALFLDSMHLCWAHLPSSKAEVDSIAYYQKTLQPNAAFKTWTGYNAHEARFKSYGRYDTPSPSTIYISSHGFGNPSLYPESRYASAALHRAGLVMATANWTTCCHKQRDLDEEDGILTAYEISNLNLSNTDLVILNGCQTGLGDIWGREGVFGLTRGFKLAGVHYIIASLWEVEDAKATEFMTRFYKAYLSGKSIPTAFEETRETMRKDKKDIASWGAWVLIK